MMKKLMMLLGCAVLLCGCTKSNIVQNQSAGPDFNVPEVVEIDWNQVGEGIEEEYTNTDDYPVSSGIAFHADDEKKEFNLNLIVVSDADKAEIAEYADLVIKAFNDEISIQNPHYEVSGGQSYGGFFEKYTLNLVILPEETPEDESTAILKKTIPADSEYQMLVIE